jgi:serine/threonine protein phosphatase PrpC
VTTRFRWGAATDTGRVRQANEDSLLAVDGLFAVADGMGGHRGGAVASRLAVEALQDRFTAAGTDVLVQAVQDANAAVVGQAADDADLQGMGTTLVAMALVDVEGHDAIAVVNVGDSRLYLLSDGELTQVTEDHSLVATMERQGRLTRAEAAVHPQRNVVTRALGIDTDVMVDSWEIQPVVGDRYLICSDGLFNEVDDNRMAATLRRLADPGEAARDLVRLANEAGGRDNITCVVVDVVDDDTPAGDAGRTGPPTATVPTVGEAETGTRTGAGGAATSGDDLATGTPGGRRQRRRARRKDPDRPRSRFTWRVALFSLLFLGVIGVAIGAIVWAGTRTYYVGVDGDQVAIFRGKPGGVLWIQPELAETTELAVAQVPPSQLQDVQDGREQASLQDARNYVANVLDEATTVIPPVVGQTTAAAVSVLAGEGLRVVTVQEPSTTVAPGTAISTDVPAGTRVDRGASITLTVSSGPPLPVDPTVDPATGLPLTPTAPTVAPVVVP